MLHLGKSFEVWAGVSCVTGRIGRRATRGEKLRWRVSSGGYGCVGYPEGRFGLQFTGGRPFTGTASRWGLDLFCLPNVHFHRLNHDAAATFRSAAVDSRQTGG